MAKYDDTPRRRLLGHLAVALMRLAALLPRGLIPVTGRAIGNLMWYLPNQSRRITLTNIRLCFPELSAREQHRLAHNNLQETAINALASVRLWIRPAETLTLITAVTGSEHITDSLAQGRPVMVLAPHLGCWELLNYWLSSNYPLHAMFKPSHLKPVNELVLSRRAHFGSVMYPATARGVASLVRAMKGKPVVTGVLPDQVPAHSAGLFSTFFGLPAFTGTLAPKLAAQTGSLAVLGYAERLPDNRGYHIHILPVPEGFYADDLQTAVDSLNTVVAEAVRQAPEQYLWNYKRFRRQRAHWHDPYR